jgi:pimeloyl-ACP methyl ester carboxylesterase
MWVKSRSEWVDVVATLNYNLVAILVDLPGRGASWPPPDEDASIEQFAREILAVMDSLEFRRFYIGGRSIGGMIALEVGNQCPDRIKGVISVEGWTHWETQEAAFGDLLENTLSGEQRRRLREHVERVKAPYTKAECLQFSRIWTRWDGSTFLERTDIPILEIWGDRGLERPSLDALRIPSRENIEVVWIRNASHQLSLEAPQRLAEAVNSFIRRVESGDRARDQDPDVVSR